MRGGAEWGAGWGQDAVVTGGEAFYTTLTPTVHSYRKHCGVQDRALSIPRTLINGSNQITKQ